MALIITGTTMTSDRSVHTARRSPGPEQGWKVSWLPGQALDRTAATTAMVLADTAAVGLREGHRLWPHIQNWAAELGLTGPDAITRIAQPPGGMHRDHDPAALQHDPSRLTSPSTVSGTS
jgi:hypothetical protein